MKYFLRLSALLLVLVGLVSPVSAQTTLSSTSLSAAITGAADQAMTITSTTGWSATGASTQYYALVDREFVSVRTVNTTSKAIGISRGQLSTRAVPHANGAIVWFIPANVGAMITYIPTGQCTRSTLQAVPLVVSGGPLIASEVGTLWDCLGVTTAGQWVQTNGYSAGAPVLGSTVSSATSVSATGTYFKMSGTVNPVSTITAPAGLSPGFCLFIEPTGAWVTDTAGNILIASTAVTGKLMVMCWNGSKWAPSY